MHYRLIGEGSSQPARTSGRHLEPDLRLRADRGRPDDLQAVSDVGRRHVLESLPPPVNHGVCPGSGSLSEVELRAALVLEHRDPRTKTSSAGGRTPESEGAGGFPIGGPEPISFAELLGEQAVDLDDTWLRGDPPSWRPACPIPANPELEAVIGVDRQTYVLGIASPSVLDPTDHARR